MHAFFLVISYNQLCIIPLAQLVEDCHAASECKIHKSLNCGNRTEQAHSGAQRQTQDAGLI